MKYTKDELRKGIASCALLNDHYMERIELTVTQKQVCAAYVKRMSQKSFFFFAKHVLEFDLLTEQTHKVWADNLQESFAARIQRMMRLKPRATYKCLKKNTALIKYGIDDDYNVKPAELINQKDFFDEGIKVTLKSGRSFTCTKDHPLKTITGWSPPEIGLRVAVQKTLPSPYVCKNSEDEYALGALLGDGCLRSNPPRMSNPDPEVRKRIEDAGFKVGYENGIEYSLVGIPKWIRDLGLYGTSSHTKFIPKEYEGSPHLLRGLFDTDGHASSKGACIVYTSVSDQLVDDVVRNLHYFGIVARKKHYRYPKSEVSPAIDAYQVTIITNDVPLFYKYIGFGIARKQKRLEEMIDLIETGKHGVHSNIDTIPKEWKDVVEWERNEKRDLRNAGIRIDNHYGTLRKKIREVGDFLNRPEINAIADPDIFWDEVLTVEEVGQVEFSAIGSDIENYMTPDGVIHHNTTLYGVGFILWLWACVSKEIRIFYTSANALLLEEVSDKVSQVLDPEQESIFQTVFGIRRDTEGKNAPKNTGDVFNIIGRSGKGFSLILRTAGGGTAGLHPNVIIVDDPMDKADRESKAIRKKKENWFDSLTPLIVPYRPKDGSPPIEFLLFIATRWHQSDLVSYIKKMDEEEQDWDIESESIYTKDGYTNYPEFISDEKIRKIKAAINMVFFACQYMNDPLPEGMRIFSESCLSFVSMRDLDMTKGQKACFFDPSQGKENSDWPAVIWTHFVPGELTVIDALDEKIELAKLIPHIAKRNKLYGVKKMTFENNGSSLVGEALRDAHKAIDYPVQIIEINHSGNKLERITFMQPDLYSGFCRFMEDWSNRYPEMMDQLLFFPNHEYVDFPDVIEMAVDHYRKNVFQFHRYESLS